MDIHHGADVNSKLRHVVVFDAISSQAMITGGLVNSCSNATQLCSDSVSHVMMGSVLSPTIYQI